MPDTPKPSRPRLWPTPEEARARARILLAPDAMLPAALDAARGLAAVAVLGFHLRSWMVVPYGEAPHHGPALAAFYLATTFGHEAVLVFFVLSGFLIGGAVLRLDFARPGAVAAYAAARLARIAPVLGGAVVLAVALRAATAPWTAPPLCRDTAGTVAANLLALGNLGAPTLCSNLPLWSLSNEAAYYLAFPTLVALVRGRRSPGVAAACLIVLAIVAASLGLTPWADQNVVLYAPAWLAGAALWWLPAGRVRPVWPGLLTLGAALAVSRLPGADRLFLARDALTVAGFTGCLVGLLGRPWPATRGWAAVRRPLAATAGALAAISFSLYVTHGPVIDAVSRWVALRGTALPMPVPSPSLLGGLFGACLGTALVFSQVFERPHRALAARLTAALTGRRSRPAEAA